MWYDCGMLRPCRLTLAIPLILLLAAACAGPGVVTPPIDTPLPFTPSPVRFEPTTDPDAPTPTRTPLPLPTLDPSSFSAPGGPISGNPTPTDEPSPVPTNESGEICECDSDLYDCEDFGSRAEAQACFDYCGGTSNDVHKLDRNSDGQVCLSLR